MLDNWVISGNYENSYIKIKPMCYTSKLKPLKEPWKYLPLAIEVKKPYFYSQNDVKKFLEKNQLITVSYETSKKEKEKGNFSDKYYIELNTDNIEDFNVVGDKTSLSAGSAVGTALVGAALLGPLGLLAGALGSKKSEIKISIKFKDGKKSLIRLDGRHYEAFISQVF
jgi:hypothetical protein